MTVHQAITEQYKWWHDQALKITRLDQTAADDLLQVVLEHCLKSKTFGGICERNEHRNYVVKAMSISYRSGAYRKLYGNQVLELNQDIHDKSSDVWMGARIDNEQLDVIISRLKPFDRDLFEVHALGGFSLEDTHQLTGIPKPYIKRNIHYTINKIRHVVCKRKKESGAPGHL